MEAQRRPIPFELKNLKYQPISAPSQSKTLDKERTNSLTPVEERLFKIVLEEYYDLFPKILITPQLEFIENLIKLIKIALVEKIKEFSEDSIVKVVSLIKAKYFEPDYLKVNNLIQSIGNIKAFEKLNSSHCISHCNKTGDPVHTCGDQLYMISPYLLCLKCRLIYHPSCVLLYCKSCKVDYYTSVSNNDKNEKYQPATWIKYHCNVVINDTMKCFKCQEVLFLNSENKKLCCLKCNFEIDQLCIKWICVICKKEFTSEAKVYNPLEFKIMKITVKQTLLNEIEAKPDYVPCCDITKDEIKKYTFYHKKNCSGILYQGFLNKKKIVVCSKCHLLYNYDNHLWLCPICKHRFKQSDQEKVDFSKTGGNLTSRGGGNKLIDIVKAFGKDSSPKSERNPPGRNGSNNVYKKFDRGITYDQEVSDFSKKYNSGINPIKNMDSDDLAITKTKSANESILNHENIKKEGRIDLNINVINQKNKQVLAKAKEKEKEEQIDKFNCEDYTVIRQIGQGTFAKIYEVEDKLKKKYAMSKILTNSSEEIEVLTKEYTMLKSLSSYKLNLINIYAIQIKQLDKTTQAMYILMDLAVRDWEKEIESRGIKKKYYTEQELITIMKELIHTFAELQRHNISHRDIKPQNILLLPDGSFRIADFGEAKRVLSSNKKTARQTIRGTELYMSPILFHALKSKGYNDLYTVHNTFKSDVFSLGLCLLLAASLTFKSLISIRELEDMLSIKLKLGGYLMKYSTKFTDLLYNMLELNEKMRFDFIELEKYIQNL